MQHPFQAKMYGRRIGGRRGARGGGGAAAPSNPLGVLADGATVFYDGDYGYTKDGSNKVSLLGSRVGGHTVEQSSGPLQPTWGATSPTGRRGITFVTASSTRLVDPLTTLAGLLDGSQAYSALWVAKFANPTMGTSQAVWSAVNAGSTTDQVYEGCTTLTGLDRRVRGTSAASTINSGGATHSTTIVCATSVYTGAAYSTWVNGAPSLVAQANVRVAVCDQFLLGAMRQSGSYLNFLGGEFYALVIALGTWTTEQRQAREAAAKSYWGTP